MKLAVVGAGWAGMAAAVTATAAGHRVSVFEASRQLGGRARALPVQLPDGSTAVLDNGQHIMVGAYHETMRLMQQVGVEPRRVLLRMPLCLRFPDGGGIALPAWRAPLDAAAGILRATGWSAGDKASLLSAALRWRLSGFRCAAGDSVRHLCRRLTPRVIAELIEPLCVSALNTPIDRSSGQVFLRVIRDALFTQDGSNLLVPRCDLGSLFPDRAAQWLQERGGLVLMAHRVQRLEAQHGAWLVDGSPFDHVVLAIPHWEAIRLLEASAIAAQSWVAAAGALRDEGIATVYATGGHHLPLPLLALRSGPQAPAQFVFDRGQLGGPAGLWAFVVSACNSDQQTLQQQVLAQAHALGWPGLKPLQTIVEKRATFACTPGLRRPPRRIAPGLLACGDYIDGPYPATLEGAVRSALEAVAEIADAGVT